MLGRLRAVFFRIRDYLIALVAVGFVAAFGVVAGEHLTRTSNALLLLVAILTASLSGRGPAMLATTVAVVWFDYFAAPPRFAVSVSDPQWLLTCAVMFAAGGSLATVVTGLREAATRSKRRESQAEALLAFTRDAADATSLADVAAAVARQVEAQLGSASAVFLADGDGLAPRAGSAQASGAEAALARAAHAARVAQEAPSGRGGARLVAVPLWSGDGSAGAVVARIAPRDAGEATALRAFVEAVARQAGIAISRLQLAEAARASALQAKAEELRSSLLSTVSHDMRTPLAVITGMASTLQHPDLAPAQREAVDTILDEAQRLSRILTNLLAMTRVESGAEPRRAWTSLEELFGAALGRLEAALEAHPVRVEVSADTLAHVDPVLVEQLLLNLLDNAAKHTPAGTEVVLRGLRGPKAAIIEAEDRGPGLPAGDPDRVFEKFFRGDAPRVAGAGLGLAVCRGIAVAHGGAIEARPNPAGGALFRVVFPDAGPPPPGPTTDEPWDDEAGALLAAPGPAPRAAEAR